VFRLLPAALAALAFLLTGCGNPVRSKVEGLIEEALPTLIGPAKSYQVTVSGSTLGMLKGKLRTTRILGRDVRFSSGITVAELVVESRRIQIDKHKHQISSVESTSYSALLAQAALNQYLHETYRQVPELNTQTAEGLLSVSAAPEVAGVRVNIKADTALKIKDNRYLILDLKKIRVAGVGTPAFAREYLESKINPVFDSASFGYDARMDRVSIGPNGVRIEGTLDLEEQLNVDG
jgi:hypothetical protein